MTKAFSYAVRKHAGKQCLGTREVLGEEDEMQANGKVIYEDTPKYTLTNDHTH